MSLQRLLQAINQYNQTDILFLNRMLTTVSDLTDPAVIQTIQGLHGLDSVIRELNAISATERAIFISRLERIIPCEGVQLPAFIDLSTVQQGQPAPVQPYFKRRDICWFDFGGVGTETDLLHLGLVWSDNPRMDDITVIPTTSQYVREYSGEFNVGRITGLPARDTILQVDKMSNISRKRAKQIRNKYVQGELHTGFVERVRNAIAILFAGEDSLDDIVRNRLGERINRRIAIYLPQDLIAFESMRFWPVRELRYDYQTNILSFRKYNDTIRHSIQLVPPDINVQITFRIRNQIYDDVYSGDSVKRRQGIVDFQQHF